MESGSTHRTPKAESEHPKITVLVAAFNEADNIGEFIESFRHLDYPSKELVLCAGGNDGTWERALAMSGDGITLLPQFVGEGKQAALRKALKAATGDVVILTDADSLLSSEAVRRLVDPILVGREKATSGVSSPKRSQLSNPFVLYQYSQELVGLERMDATPYLASLEGRNSAVLRSLLTEVGGFGDDVSTGIDSFLAKKIVARGYRIRFIPDSVAETDYPLSLWAYCRQRARWRRNAIIHSLRFRLYGRLLTTLGPPVIGLSLFSLPVLSIWLGPPVLLAWSALVVSMYVRHVSYMRTLLKSRGMPFTPRTWSRVALYMWVPWAAQLLALFELSSGRLRARW